MNIFKKFIKYISATSSPNNEQKSIVKKDSYDIVESLLIPEPTKSLLWTTKEDVSKIESTSTITIVTDGANFQRKENGFYSEPSLIWEKLPIKSNVGLIEEAMYWPSYSSFSPEARYQYLRWLGDITQPTNLSYVFLYFYGLERHLLVGEYDLAVDEIARLLKAHPKKSFVNYASQSLIVASLGKRRLDIIKRVPSLLEEEIDEALALRIIKGTSITPDDVISISNRVGFSNKRYLKLYPQAFKEELQANIDVFENKFGALLSNFKIDDFEQREAMVFANLSIPEHIRQVKVPIILENEKFSKGIRSLLQAAHNGVKTRIAEGNVDRVCSPSPEIIARTRNNLDVTQNEINELLSNLKTGEGKILDLHFAILEYIREHYPKRENEEDYHKAIVGCRAQIKIQADVANQFKHDYSGDTLPSHTGYNQLVVILEKEKKFLEALALAKEAQSFGWNGDWSNKIEKLTSKLN
jgi:sulfur transfer protein SufE